MDKRFLWLAAFALLLSFAAEAQTSFDEPIFSPAAEGEEHYPPSKIVYTEYLENGNYYLSQKLYEEAKQLFWKAIHLYPDKPDAYVNLGIVHMQQGELDNALRIFKQAEGLSPKDYQQAEILFYNLGLCNFLKEDYLEAINYLEKALNEFPEFSQARYYLGIAQHKLNQYEDAYKNVFVAAYQFEQEGNQKAASEAKEFLRSLESEHKLNQASLTNSLFEEGRRALDDKKLDRAIYCFEESALITPDDLKANYELAELYAQKDSYHNVIGYLNKVIAQDPSQIKAYLDLSQAYRKIERYDLAVATLEGAAKNDKDNPLIYYNMALACIEGHDFNTARRYLNEAQTRALKNKDDTMLEKIQQANLLTEEYKTAQAKPPHYPKKFTYKASLPLYPEPAVPGNAGNLKGGYFTPAVNISQQEEKKEELKVPVYPVD